MKGRLLLLLMLILVWLAGIGARLYRLQVERFDEFSQRAERQQQRMVRLDAARGTIYDARGRELAVSVEVDSLYAVPPEIDQAATTARALARVLGRPAVELERLLREDRGFVWIQRKLDRALSQAVRDLDLPGLYFLRESKRYYPMRQLAAQVLGYVGTDNIGLGGLESAYDPVISGRPAFRTILRDARRGTVLYPESSFDDAEPGRDLHLTLDATLQYIAERELRRGVEQYDAKAGSVVMLDPRNGSVLAMATIPSFDPNHFSQHPRDAWRNRPVTDAYEPGSTFKMITAATAVEDGVVRPDDLFDCEEGRITVSATPIADHQPFGLLTFRQVVTKSSNVGIIKTALMLDDGRFYQRIRAFGFGRPTGIDLPGENAGILRAFGSRGALDKAYVSFGQSIAVTPLQLANAFAAIANGGQLLRPRVVRAVGDDASPAVPELVSQPVSPSTVRTLLDILVGVVEEGTGTAAAIDGYRVAGKTGTAQKSGPGGYSGHVANFVGLAPVSAPRLVCLVAVDEPTRSIHGGRVAAPIFAEIVRQSLLYLGVPPERNRGTQEPRWIIRRARPGAGRGEVVAASVPNEKRGRSVVDATGAL
jgi:cell division protein FtsI (penicillin-binding protein 3)